MESRKSLLLIFIFVPLCFWSLTWGQKTMYEYDNMGWADKVLLINLSTQAIMDAQLRIRQIHDIKDEHSYTMAFDVGVVMGNMREKYRRMVETYREYRDKHSKRSTFFPPSYNWDFMAGYYILAMQLIHIQEVEIDKLVHVLESVDNDELNPDPRYDHLKRTQKNKILRAREQEIVKQMGEEQELKSSLREQHLMRRLRLKTAQHTTAKRFQRQWPVEGNWDLGAYGDMGLYGGH